MARVLVTGGSGFIGGHLVQRLTARGDQVRCLVRANSARERLEPLGVDFVVGDINDRQAVRAAVQGVDVVFQASGLTTAWHHRDMDRVNGQGTELLAEACAEQRPAPTLIHLSSLAAAGPTQRGGCRHEGDRPAPVSHYGRSKLAGELAVRRHAAEVPSTIIRPGIVFGEYDRLLLPAVRMIRYFRVHFYPGLTAPDLSYIWVHDLVDLLIAAWQRGRRLAPSDALRSPTDQGQGVYFAAAPTHPNYAELGRLIARALDLRYCAMVPMFFPLPWLAAGVSEMVGRMTHRSMVLNLDKIREAAEESWVCSIRAAREELGYQPSAPLAEQLRTTVDWYRQQGWV